MSIINFTQSNIERTISVASIQQNDMKLRAGLIAPATEDISTPLAPEHTSEPIKSMDDIMRISRFLMDNGRYRDNMLFIVGINFGLRVSDLLQLRFGHLINDNSTFKSSFPIFEQKTRNTRKHKRNRYITINAAVRQAVITYLEHSEETVCLSDYMFRSESNRGKSENKPMHRNSVDRILKGLAYDLDINVKVSTHTLRKTFAYRYKCKGVNTHPSQDIRLSPDGHVQQRSSEAPPSPEDDGSLNCRSDSGLYWNYWRRD